MTAKKHSICHVSRLKRGFMLSSSCSSLLGSCATGFFVFPIIMQEKACYGFLWGRTRVQSGKKRHISSVFSSVMHEWGLSDNDSQTKGKEATPLMSQVETRCTKQSAAVTNTVTEKGMSRKRRECKKSECIPLLNEALIDEVTFCSVSVSKFCEVFLCIFHIFFWHEVIVKK